MEQVFKPTRCLKSALPQGSDRKADKSLESEEHAGTKRKEGRSLNLGFAASVLGGKLEKQQRRCLEWEQERVWKIVDTKQRY